MLKAEASVHMSDTMNLAQFEDEVRRVGRYAIGDPVTNALGEVVAHISAYPALHESRILSRVLHALSEHHGQFRRAEAAAFGPVTLKLVIALLNTARAGTSTGAQWLDAVAAADAAST